MLILLYSDKEEVSEHVLVEFYKIAKILKVIFLFFKENKNIIFAKYDLANND